MSTDDPADIRLMAATNRWVKANLQPGNKHSGRLAGIRAGITRAGEAQALAQAAGFVEGLGERQRTSALRAAAIRAINKDVDHTSSGSVGSALQRLNKIEGSDSIAEQLAALPLMNRDAAALVLDGLIGRCAKHNVPVNFLDLARTLVHWGDGAGSRSARWRNRLVLDFYGAGAASSSH